MCYLFYDTSIYDTSRVTIYDTSRVTIYASYISSVLHTDIHVDMILSMIYDQVIALESQQRQFDEQQALMQKMLEQQSEARRLEEEAAVKLKGQASASEARFAEMAAQFESVKKELEYSKASHRQQVRQRGGTYYPGCSISRPGSH